MINNKPVRTNSLWLVTAVGLLAMLLLFGLAAAHAQQAPREILVNAECNDASKHEHIRFGLESSHYYSFWAKAGQSYKVSTKIYATNTDGLALDTRLLLFRHNPLEHPGQPILAENDDVVQPAGSATAQDLYASSLEYLISENGYYWIEVQNVRAGGEGSYCLEVKLMLPRDTQRRFDVCEPNDTFEQACEIELQAQISNTNTMQTNEIPKPDLTFNFAPLSGAGPDQDYYKIWVKAGERYTCETKDLTAINDTALALYDQHRVRLGSNDDVEIGKRTSKVQHVVATYTGWLYIHVWPVVEVNYEYAHLYEYQLKCTRDAAPIDNYVPPPPRRQRAARGRPHCRKKQKKRWLR